MDNCCECNVIDILCEDCECCEDCCECHDYDCNCSKCIQGDFDEYDCEI